MVRASDRQREPQLLIKIREGCSAGKEWFTSISLTSPKMVNQGRLGVEKLVALVTKVSVLGGKNGPDDVS